MSVLELAKESEDEATIKYLSDIVEKAQIDLRAATIRGDARAVKKLIEDNGARVDDTDAVRLDLWGALAVHTHGISASQGGHSRSCVCVHGCGCVRGVLRRWVNLFFTWQLTTAPIMSSRSCLSMELMSRPSHMYDASCVCVCVCM